MLINGYNFLNTFKTYKFCWLSGRVGGGKTSFAFYLAGTLFNEGRVDNIVANIPSVISTFPQPGMPAENSAVIVDEGGLFMKFSRDFETVAAMLRKLNNYIILPSFIPPAREFRYLTVQREMNLRKLIPLPINAWVYKWRLNLGTISEEDWFVWVNPESVWGLYDSDATPADDAGITPWIDAYTKEKMVSYNERYKKKGKSTRNADGVRTGSANNAVVNSIRDAGEAMLAGASSIRRAADKIAKRSRLR